MSTSFAASAVGYTSPVLGSSTSSTSSVVRPAFCSARRTIAPCAWPGLYAMRWPSKSSRDSTPSTPGATPNE